MIYSIAAYHGYIVASFLMQSPSALISINYY